MSEINYSYEQYQPSSSKLMKFAGAAALAGSLFMLNDIAEHEVPADERIGSVDFSFAEFPYDDWRVKRLAVTGSTFIAGAAMLLASGTPHAAEREQDQ